MRTMAVVCQVVVLLPMTKEGEIRDFHRTLRVVLLLLSLRIAVRLEEEDYLNCQLRHYHPRKKTRTHSNLRLPLRIPQIHLLNLGIHSSSLERIHPAQIKERLHLPENEVIHLIMLRLLHMPLCLLFRSITRLRLGSSRIRRLLVIHPMVRRCRQ